MNSIKASKISLAAMSALLLVFASLQLVAVRANELGAPGGPQDGGDLSEVDGVVSNNRFQHLLANLRFRRQAGPYQQRRQPQQQQQSFPLAQVQQQQQSFFDDEQTIRNQLPDLIAQAHNDKAVERALLKMLINASLRSALSNVARPQQQALLGQQWQDGEATATDQDQQMARFSRFDQQQQQQHNFDNLDSLSGAIDSLTSVANANGASRLVQSDQFQQQPGVQVDKREYIKPCSFNAVSCVRTPFRKL